jgi:hypothetical protein
LRVALCEGLAKSNGTADVASSLVAARRFISSPWANLRPDTERQAPLIDDPAQETTFILEPLPIAAFT